MKTKTGLFTLAMLARRNPRLSIDRKPGGSLHVWHTPETRAGLFNLQDFVVRSVNGPRFLMVPRCPLQIALKAANQWANINTL